MIGDGPDRSTAEHFAREHRLTNRVAFLGNVGNLEQIVSASDAFLLPSEAESFGMAALEAMACAVPVIATRAGGLPEVVDDRETGFLLPVGDVDGMAARAIEILSDHKLRHRMGSAARNVAITRFDVDRILPMYREMYERVISGRKAAAASPPQ
jgi:N-acetyl-alpha-D-glucosaminyl L-malate synthase BshA